MSRIALIFPVLPGKDARDIAIGWYDVENKIYYIKELCEDGVLSVEKVAEILKSRPAIAREQISSAVIIPISAPTVTGRMIRVRLIQRMPHGLQ